MCLGGAAFPLTLLGGGASFPRSCWVALLDLLLQWLVPPQGSAAVLSVKNQI